MNFAIHRIRKQAITLIPAVLILFVVNCYGAPVVTSVTDDLEAIEICEQGLQNALDYIRRNGDLWGLDGQQDRSMVGREQRETITTAWSGILDYFAQLDYIKQTNLGFFLNDSDTAIEEQFLPYYLAFLVQYRYALLYLDLLERNKGLDNILNEAHPALGLSDNTYRNFKFHFLNAIIATQFVALYTMDLETKVPRAEPIDAKINAAVKYIFSMGMGRGVGLTIANAVKLVRQGFFKLWFPLQRGAAEFLAKKKVWRRGEFLITEADIAKIAQQLEPGDIIVQRREWALTNVGIPGYWTHSALYVGTPAQWQRYFGDDSTSRWIEAQGYEDGSFEELLRGSYPIVHAELTAGSATGEPLPIVESLKPGVILNTMEKSLAADGLAVLRPKLSRKEKAVALIQAFGYVGRPYDYNFDFLTDSSLVCSELIYKAYEPSEHSTGVTFETHELFGRFITSPNDMVREFDENFGTDRQQLDLVLFFDGIEDLRRVIPSTPTEFRNSWRRPDWHIFVQDIVNE